MINLAVTPIKDDEFILYVMAFVTDNRTGDFDFNYSVKYHTFQNGFITVATIL
ncbi:Uncharacterised protein [Salmonella enterica subsp. enterica serovar Bovismorbificans]|uniref:Uncharacterized protein n=1 Tax=Salmonella enterica subsp. enterica serovar Bovismorbificans TaxID=58097 RepID=A0A655BML1_SALET|nr:Uncharacterised protein [Salmonella enterica subsp. enterica serovar Bovismorbificans]CNT80247.1 Uncharacterised protein [Salmonella enterica subsp. enterica serovar Bovismorbificans]